MKICHEKGAVVLERLEYVNITSQRKLHHFGSMKKVFVLDIRAMVLLIKGGEWG